MSTLSSKSQVLVVGAGRLGSAVVRRLQASERYGVIIADPHRDTLQSNRERGIEGVELCGTQYLPILKNAMQNVAAVVCAAPDFVALDVARAARECGCHYLDASENPATRSQIAALAADAPSAFVPGCGLAPGYVGSLAAEVLREAGSCAEVTVYVGALPKQRSNRLGYGNMWGIDGLMTEYTSPCRAIRDGRIVDLLPLSELEDFEIKGMKFEAFTTAGTLDDLVQSYAGRVSGLAFKTIRYPGHLDYMKLLIDDLGLGARTAMLKSLLLNGLPKIDADQLMICVESRAPANAVRLPGHATALRRELHFTSTELANGEFESSVASVSADHLCSVMDLLCTGKLPGRGLLPHAEISLSTLSQSAFFEPLNQG